MTTKVTSSTLANTTVSAGNYGGSSQIPTFAVDAQGRLTQAGNTTPVIANTQITGLINDNQISGVSSSKLSGTIASSQIASITSSQVTSALGYTPVQQGTGIGQLSNVVKLGWNGYVPKLTIDNYDWGEIASAGSLLGVGQTWQNVTASRVSGTTYTNSTAKPIVFYAFGPSSGTNTITFSTAVNGVTLGTYTGDWTNGRTSMRDIGSSGDPIPIIVPTGQTYSFTCTNGITKWMELR